MGFGYWSLSAYLKVKVKNALQFIENFEAAVADEARRRGVDGVICGHIHKAEMRQIDGVAYINDGDWVESCTALVEHFDGRLEILEWAKLRAWVGDRPAGKRRASKPRRPPRPDAYSCRHGRLGAPGQWRCSDPHAHRRRVPGHGP